MREKIKYDGNEFDSNEELVFYYYCEELLKYGYLKSFTFHPDTIDLTPAILYIWEKDGKVKQTTLIREHSYTPDYQLNWDKKAQNIFYNNINDNVKLENFIAQKDISIIEIKPQFDMHNMIREFKINQKIIYHFYEKYVQLIIPINNKKKCLFSETFTPDKVLYTKTGKLKKLNFKIKSIEEYINAGDNNKKDSNIRS